MTQPHLDSDGLPTLAAIRDLAANLDPMAEVSPVHRAVYAITALAASDWYQDRDDDLQTMLRDVLADLRHAYDLLGLRQDQFDTDARAARRHYACEASDMGGADVAFFAEADR